MSRQKHTAEEIINKLREAEVLQAKGMSIEEVMRQLGVRRCNVLQVAEGIWGLELTRQSD